MAAPKATTIKDAIKRWEDKTGQQAATATEVSLIFQWPPIEKMDNTLAALVNCEKLSLSTNMIEKVTGLNSLKKLRILSLGRNYIKSFAGMESLGDTLEELWISYNLIEKIKGINVLRNLKVLYMSNNLVKEWSEFNKLQELPHLEDLLFVGNPLYDGCELEAWRSEAARRLPNLKKLDGETVIREDDPPITVADMQLNEGDAVETLVSAETND
ncbi:dynein axonemal light chain 1-like [Plodia interpunctella]|uniref:dynein axonemal light chain 1-like n=1 Tax=Plodia interpunctella TaxID=58824 RepID=UPI00236831EC|nr:dynein axonemal light chain 1-like [Plodia interpunctella]XP_053622322.1 dynein axonemal light chain 1-like [Plodia interpunctella]